MPRSNYWTPLQASAESDDEEEHQEHQFEQLRKEFISPIKVLSQNCEQFHKWFKNANITDYYIKKISIGTKIICKTKECYNKIVVILKDHNCQFFTHQSKYEKPTKFVMFGLDGKTPDEVKRELISLKFKCIDVKKIEKKYEDYIDTLYIVYFENGTVRLNDLKQNVKALFYTIISWDFQRKLKDKVVQCHNCQMYGHGERGCWIRTRCAICSGRHKTTECANKENKKCANCKQLHVSTDISCPARVSFLELRAKIQNRNAIHNNKQRNVNRTRSNVNIIHSNNFPRLVRNNDNIVNETQQWPITRNNNGPVYSNDMFSIEEISQLTLDVINNLKHCKTRDEQFHVITQLAVKYLYNV